MMRNLLMLGTLLSTVAATGAELARVEPRRLDAPVFNPRMGLYLQYPPLNLPADHWTLELAQIAYRRVEWADVNPEPGVYAFDEVFGPQFEEWVGKRGMRVAFRVMCQSMHSAKEYVTPKWVFEAGVPGVEHVALRGQTQTDPVFWHPRYLELQSEFVAALGAYLDGKPGLEYIDIGSIGEWGEMHLARWTPEQLANTGHSHTAYVEAYRKIIDAHARAFVKTPVFLNVGGQNNHTINDYAARRGIHFRQDGLKPGGASYNCGEWLYKPYAPHGVLCNFEFHSGYREMVAKNWDLAATIDAVFAAPISYLNMNLGTFGENPPAVMQEQLRRAAMKVGYRLLPVAVDYIPALSVSPDRRGRFVVRSTWRNEGLAAPVGSFAVRWTLRGADGAVAASALTYPTIPTTQWWPENDYQVDELLAVPAGLAPGTYRLEVAMLDPEAEQTINLAIEGRQEDGSYALATVEAQQRTAPAETRFHAETFAEGAGGWNASAEGVQAEAIADPAAPGGHCLHVSGTKGRAWNYASGRLPRPVTPFALCRITARLKVDSLEPGNKPPYLKIGVNNADGKWLDNFGSNRYDIKAMGTWQTLTILADLPAGAATADLAIETGDLDLPITIDLRLADVKMEILEQP